MICLMDFSLHLTLKLLSKGPLLREGMKKNLGKLFAKPRTRASIWHPDVCKNRRHRSERLRMSILRKEGKGGGITRGN